MGNKITGKDLLKIGFPMNNTVNIALGQIHRYKNKEKKERLLQEAKAVLLNPRQFVGDGVWGKLAEAFMQPVEVTMQTLRSQRVPYAIYGEEGIGDEAKRQLYDALKLPVAVKGALMPDAHAGYGLPIGGVLATDNAVIPYAVGVDIGCRMSLSIYDLPASYLQGKSLQLRNFLIDHTKFGMSETHKVKADHSIFSRAEFQDIPLLKSLKDKAYKQLGTSGGGNHFVEFGIVDLSTAPAGSKLEPGTYVAVLAHSGSRGLGANIAKHYTYLASKQCPLPRQVQHLAWLDLNTHDGQEYWLAMNLAGDYAAACHEDIHRRMANCLGKRPILTISNHHNFAWREEVDGKSCIVHRKGATPAGAGVLGIIPGSMTAAGYIVEGRGEAQSLNSASHGAGRLLSRADCKATISKSAMASVLRDHGITLVGAAVDEAPMAYKDIQQVMAQQEDLVRILGTFTPKVVRMDQ